MHMDMHVDMHMDTPANTKQTLVCSTRSHAGSALRDTTSRNANIGTLFQHAWQPGDSISRVARVTPRVAVCAPLHQQCRLHLQYTGSSGTK
jgi:hypothetical protein